MVGSPRVAVVSESVARRYWPDADPLGRRLRIGRGDAEWLEVVGVVDDVRARPSQDVRPTIYVPLRQNPVGGAEFVIRGSGSGLALLPDVRRELHGIDTELPVVLPRTLEEIFDDMLAAQRLPAYVTASFAVLALVLAMLGVYGIMAYSVAARRRELGIRVALGARRLNVIALVMGQGMAMAMMGVAAGLGMAAVASRTLTGLLVGVTPHDVATFTIVPVVLLLVSCGASLIPARRCLAIQPLEALRAE
jgi:putative ABC transport system permease protein